MRQPAVRIEADDDGAVFLLLGGEDGVAVGAGGGAGHHRQHVFNGLADTTGFVAVKIVQNNVVVGVDDHRAGAGLIHIGNAGGGALVDFAHAYVEHALGTRSGFAREEAAQHPSAVAADTGDTAAVSGEIAEQVVGTVLRLRIGGHAHARGGAARHKRGHGGVGILRLHAAAVGVAGHFHRHGVDAAQMIHHLDDVKAGYGDGARGDIGLTAALVSEGFYAYLVKLPVAVDGGFIRSGKSACRGQQHAHKHVNEKFRGSHEMAPFALAGKKIIYIIYSMTGLEKQGKPMKRTKISYA